MKKGDIIEKRKEMPTGTILLRNLRDHAQGEDFMLHLEKWYNFRETPKMKIESTLENGLCVVLDEDTYLSIQARVNWVVDQEVAIEYLDTGGMVIFRLDDPDQMGWVVVHESTPVYQDSVEHMTDEELRASIEELRAKRLSTPQVKKTRVVNKVGASVQTPEDKQLASTLDALSPSAKIDLMRKLGLVD